MDDREYWMNRAEYDADDIRRAAEVAAQNPMLQAIRAELERLARPTCSQCGKRPVFEHYDRCATCILESVADFIESPEGYTDAECREARELAERIRGFTRAKAE